MEKSESLSSEERSRNALGDALSNKVTGVQTDKTLFLLVRKRRRIRSRKYIASRKLHQRVNYRRQGRGDT